MKNIFIALSLLFLMGCSITMKNTIKNSTKDDVQVTIDNGQLKSNNWINNGEFSPLIYTLSIGDSVSIESKMKEGSILRISGILKTQGGRIKDYYTTVSHETEITKIELKDTNSFIQNYNIDNLENYLNSKYKIPQMTINGLITPKPIINALQSDFGSIILVHQNSENPKIYDMKDKIDPAILKTLWTFEDFNNNNSGNTSDKYEFVQEKNFISKLNLSVPGIASINANYSNSDAVQYKFYFNKIGPISWTPKDKSIDSLISLLPNRDRLKLFYYASEYKDSIDWDIKFMADAIVFDSYYLNTKELISAQNNNDLGVTIGVGNTNYSRTTKQERELICPAQLLYIWGRSLKTLINSAFKDEIASLIIKTKIVKKINTDYDVNMLSQSNSNKNSSKYINVSEKYIEDLTIEKLVEHYQISIEEARKYINNIKKVEEQIKQQINKNQ